MKIAYFDCFSGVSGDMLLGAIVDAGVPVESLQKEIDKLSLTPAQVTGSAIKKHEIAATRVKVIAPDEKKHRHLKQIEEVISASNLADKTKSSALRIFGRLAKAEARVHQTSIENVHFHEVGAIDTLIDVVGTIAGLEILGIEKVYASSLSVGRGAIETAHGKLPLPAPAVTELLQGFPVKYIDIEAELVTPTGAAILTSIADFKAPPEFTITKVGYGAGRRNFEDWPNLLRLIVGETLRTFESDRVIQIETNIDNTSPEVLGYVAERLFEAGALDVYYSPLVMKKGRPGILLGLLCRPEDRQRLCDIIFAETGAIGARFLECDRLKLPRTEEVVQTSFGSVRIKVTELPGKKRATPEYSDCAELATRFGVPYHQVYDEAQQAFWNRK